MLLPGQSPGDLGLVIFSRGGYQTTANVRCDGLPVGTTCQFGQTSLLVPAGGSIGTSLLVNIGTRLPVGDYPFQIIASDNAISQALTVTLRVGDFAVAFRDATVALPTGFATINLDVATVNNFVGNVNFTCQGLPVGATCSQSNIIVGVGFSTLAVAVPTNNVPAGDYPFTITGDSGFTAHSVNAVLHVGDVGSGTVSPSTATLSVGQSANFNLVVNSVNGFAGPVQLGCKPTINGGFVNGIKCAFSPPTAVFDSTGKLNSQLTITVLTRPASTTITAQARWSPSPLWMGLVLAPVAILLARRKSGRQRVLFCVGIISLALIVSCGGGGSGSGGPPPPPPPTPTPTPGPQTVSIDVLVTSPFPQTVNRVVANLKVTVQ